MGYACLYRLKTPTNASNDPPIVTAQSVASICFPRRKQLYLCAVVIVFIVNATMITCNHPTNVPFAAKA